MADKGLLTFELRPATAFCLAASAQPIGLSGDTYRHTRARAAWAVQALSQILPPEIVDGFNWLALAEQVDQNPAQFLATIGKISTAHHASNMAPFPNVIRWSIADVTRIALVPSNHWLLIEDTAPFRATLELPNGNAARRPQHVSSIPAAGLHIACFPPRTESEDAALMIERFTNLADHPARLTAEVRFLSAVPPATFPAPRATDLALLTNGHGALARVCADFGRITSKYDCVLGANLHPTLPVDRHILAKRLRAWINADGFITPLDFHNLARFTPGPPAIWHFVAQAGDGRTVELQITADLLPERNTTVFCFSRPSVTEAHGKQLPPDADVRLTVRVDIEDRNFHSETKHNDGANHHFTSNCQPLAQHGTRHTADETHYGFAFTPADKRHLRVYATGGAYHPAPEWCLNIPHPVEASRGQEASGDAFSPGWFELPMSKGTHLDLILTADATNPSEAELMEFKQRAHTLGAACVAGPANQPTPSPSPEGNKPADAPVTPNAQTSFDSALLRAARAFVVRRGEGKTVIAGYPWFLDWGRDTLICARGLLAAGMMEEVREILLTFARFEEHGTLPNIIHGEHIGNRDTSDAPLWFGVVCEEFAALAPRSQTPDPNFYSTAVDAKGRTVAEVLRDIAVHHLHGTPNGIRVDAASGLVYSPSHFTWMDTNHPAGTPREGYPIEIQCLWIRLLRQLDHLGAKSVNEPWSALADRAQASLERYFWLEEQGWFADCLRATNGAPAANAQVDDALRSNCLFTVSLGLVTGERARRTVEAARRWLVVTGGLRSLAPLPVKLPLEIRNHGQLLNDPHHPYWGHYEGDEDTRRKPAYHNGTAWTWTFPIFCEALAAAWEFSPEAVAAARAYLTSSEGLLHTGCLGQLPEILDGDAPHTQRGCDAQAWGVTEALRVWRRFNQK